MKRKPTKVNEGVGVADFKAHCLQLVENVGSKGARYVITKHGTPVARVVPVVGQHQSLKGMLKDQITIVSDIVAVGWTQEWETKR